MLNEIKELESLEKCTFRFLFRVIFIKFNMFVSVFQSFIKKTSVESQNNQTSQIFKKKEEKLKNAKYRVVLQC